MTDFVVRRVPPSQTRPLRRAVLRPHETLAEMAGHEPPDAVAYAAFLGDALAVVGLVGPDGEDEGDWRIRGMAADPATRGMGGGAAVLEALLDHAQRAGATRVWCNARTPARALYARAGFRVVSDEFEIDPIGPHVEMELRLG